MSKDMPIGIFDSGLGGLCALKEIHRLIPGAELIYFGDTGRTPYGTRSAETIKRYAAQDAAFLLSRGVGSIVVACGTVSSVALPELAQKLPVPVVGVIEPAAERAARVSKNGKIGVMGTGATIGSGVFERTLRRINPTLETASVACPLLVPIVEYGFASDEIALLAVRKYLAPILQAGADTVILGCTHFPILINVLKTAAPGVNFVDSGACAAAELLEILPQTVKNGNGKIHCYVSDTPNTFNATARVFLGEEVDFDVTRVDVEHLPATEE